MITKPKKVQILVKTIYGKGTCPLGLKADDRFVFETDAMPEGFCDWAFHDIYPELTTLKYGGDFDWSEEPGTVVACCTDGLNPVVFELRRLES